MIKHTWALGLSHEKMRARERRHAQLDMQAQAFELTSPDDAKAEAIARFHAAVRRLRHSGQHALADAVMRAYRAHYGDQP